MIRYINNNNSLIKSYYYFFEFRIISRDWRLMRFIDLCCLGHYFLAPTPKPPYYEQRYHHHHSLQ